MIMGANDNVLKRGDNRWRFPVAYMEGTGIMNSEISGSRGIVRGGRNRACRRAWAVRQAVRTGQTGSSLERVVKIGHGPPLTGEIAHLGKDMKTGAPCDR